MKERVVTATQFKAHCLRLMDEVAEHGETLVVTKHNRPVVRVTGIEPEPSLHGSVTFLVDDETLIEPISETWEADA